MIEIGRRLGGSVPVKRSEILQTQSISAPYLENILALLRDGKLIRTIRGANGGILLGQPPEKISLFDIVTALEGPIVPAECLENPVTCRKTPDCSARKAWKKLYDVQVEVLQSMTLKELCKTEDNGYTADYVI
jgi:Rrf2 family protein